MLRNEIEKLEAAFYHAVREIGDEEVLYHLVGIRQEWELHEYTPNDLLTEYANGDLLARDMVEIFELAHGPSCSLCKEELNKHSVKYILDLSISPTDLSFQGGISTFRYQLDTIMRNCSSVVHDVLLHIIT